MHHWTKYINDTLITSRNCGHCYIVRSITQLKSQQIVISHANIFHPDTFFKWISVARSKMGAILQRIVSIFVMKIVDKLVNNWYRKCIPNRNWVVQSIYFRSSWSWELQNHMLRCIMKNWVAYESSITPLEKPFGQKVIADYCQV